MGDASAGETSPKHTNTEFRVNSQGVVVRRQRSGSVHGRNMAGFLPASRRRSWRPSCDTNLKKVLLRIHHRRRTRRIHRRRW